MGDRNRGLIGKYHVSRVDGKPVGDCIVLPLEDPNSWDALMTWANVVEWDGYKELANDVRMKVHEHAMKQENRQ